MTTALSHCRWGLHRPSFNLDSEAGQEVPAGSRLPPAWEKTTGEFSHAQRAAGTHGAPVPSRLVAETL